MRPNGTGRSTPTCAYHCAVSSEESGGKAATFDQTYDPGAAGPALRAPLRDLPLAEQTMPVMLRRQADRYGDKPFIVTEAETWTYRQTVDVAARTAGALAGRGVRRGDHVGIMAGNGPDLMATILGCAWLGAIVVPLNTFYRGPVLKHVLTNSGCSMLITEAEYVPVIEACDPPATLTDLWLLDPEEVPEPTGSLRLGSWSRAAEAIPAAPVKPGDPMAILYTSGTSGVSKGVRCPHAQFYWWAIVASEHLEITEDDVLYQILPLFHTNAINSMVQAMVAGATYTLGARFSASRFWRDVAAADATVIYVLGAILPMLCSRPPAPGDTAHRVRVALSPATPTDLGPVFRDRFGVRIVDGFGSTETNMVIGTRPDRHRPGYMGVPVDDFELRVVDEDGVDVPYGTPGELLCRSGRPFAFATAYHGMPEATAHAWRDGWFHTGDRVVWEPDGWLRFTDRIKDVIRRRGENISSYEVEQVMGQHPSVADIAVIAVPSDLAEDEVMAVVQPVEGVELDIEELIEFCRPQLPYFALPRYVDVVARLPTTENSKVTKGPLRERGVTPTTVDLQVPRPPVGESSAAEAIPAP